ncbi:MAG: class I SAM-dependent methyltransferase [Sphingomonadaceae bacterium]|nr:class I SAM-dependent methyltransferase [Sphingomonadaceae bacterium]
MQEDRAGFGRGTVDSQYFSHVRSEIAPLIHLTPSRVLEIGCGTGATLGWLRSRFPGAHLTGVEGAEENRDALARVADDAVIADLDQGLPVEGRFDLILALDVLEHLKDPEAMMKAAAARLTPNGEMIISLPNIAHFSVLGPLLFKRRFDYAAAGIMDRTHLRMFTESSALRLANDADLTVTEGIVNGPDNPRARLLDKASLGIIRHWLTRQYVFRAVHGSIQSPVNWRPSGLTQQANAQR